MANNDKRVTEADTRKLVMRLLDSVGIDADFESSGSRQFYDAMEAACKKKNGNRGFTDVHYACKGFIIIIENKCETKMVEKLEENDMGQQILLEDAKSTEMYAVNGAVYYAKSVLEKESLYEHVFAIGFAGVENHYIIQPYYVNREGYKRLDELQTFEVLNEKNIDEYYRVAVLGEPSILQKEQKKIADFSNELHEQLRTFGKLGADNKATVVSACLLALKAGLSPFELQGRDIEGREEANDGFIIYNKIKKYVNEKITDAIVRDNLLLHFEPITKNIVLNTVRSDLDGFTPLRKFVTELSENVMNRIEEMGGHDILGQFYTEFVRYGGSDGSDLGIVLTPSHITSLMAELLNISSEDIVIDPTMGTGSFPLAALNIMAQKIRDDALLSNSEKQQKIMRVTKNNLYGIEVDRKLFAIATTNMLLRNGVSDNIFHDNVFSCNIDWNNEEHPRKQPNRLLMNPPYSQAKKSETSSESEMQFILRALTFLPKDGMAAFIVPQSTVTQGPKGVSKNDYNKLKKKLLADNQIMAVITMNGQTFYPKATDTVIILIKKGVAQGNYNTLFYDFRDDGYSLNHHLGLLPDGSAEEKRKRLLDVVLNNYKVDSSIAVYHQITEDDEWLHSYFYFNDEVPTEKAFKNTIAEYMTYEFRMRISNRGYLFETEEEEFNGEEV